jgi:hypothetical protein
MHATWDGWLAQRQLDDLGVVWCGVVWYLQQHRKQPAVGNEPAFPIARQPAGAMSALVYWLDTGLPILAQSGLPLPGFPAIA